MHSTQDSKDAQQPKDNRNDYHDIDDLLYLRVHWNVRVDQPQKNADND
jgi:hypothetical protein